jgi:drug/metabolite transporter (DMT)-like permease
MMEYRKNPFWKQQNNISRVNVLWGGLGLGVFMFAGSSLQQIALHTTSVANAAYLTTLYVPLVPVFGLIFFGIHLPWMRWLAVLVFMAGSWMMTGTDLGQISYGDWLVVSSAIFWAFHIMLVGALVGLTKMPFQLAFIQTILTALFSLIVFIIVDNIDLMLAYAVLPDILFAGVLSIGVGFTLQLVAQQNCSSSAAALLLSLEGVFAALSGWILLEQDMTAMAIMGAGFIMVAILLVELTPARRIKPSSD